MSKKYAISFLLGFLRNHILSAAIAGLCNVSTIRNQEYFEILLKAVINFARYDEKILIPLRQRWTKS